MVGGDVYGDSFGGVCGTLWKEEFGEMGMVMVMCWKGR